MLKNRSSSFCKVVVPFTTSCVFFTLTAVGAVITIPSALKETHELPLYPSKSDPLHLIVPGVFEALLESVIAPFTVKLSVAGVTPIPTLPL